MKPPGSYEVSEQMFELIYNIEQDMWGRSQIQITREKKKKRKKEKKRLIIFY